MLLAFWNISADAAAVTLGAGLAALLAAVTAQWRLRAQLDHDAKLRERDATRDVLDRIATELDRAAEAMNVAGDAFQLLYRLRSGAAKTGETYGIAEAEDAATDAIDSLQDLRVPLMAASFRLHLRIADDQPMIGRLFEWRETFGQLAVAYQTALEASDADLETAYDDAWGTVRQLAQQLNAFLTAARTWAQDPSA